VDFLVFPAALRVRIIDDDHFPVLAAHFLDHKVMPGDRRALCEEYPGIDQNKARQPLTKLAETCPHA